MNDQTDPNANLYKSLGVNAAYTVDQTDHWSRRALIEEHRVRRACAQVALLQRLAPDVATGVQLVLLEMEADMQSERHELDAEWLASTLKAYQAGQQAGHANGYSEAVTDAQIGLSANPPEITH